MYSDVSKYNLIELGRRRFPLHLESRQNSTSVHPGIAAICKFIETNNEFVVVQEYSKHSMLSLSRFHAKTSMSSPSLARGIGHGSKDLRLRFIIYQLLQVTAFLHSQGLCMDVLKPGRIMLDDDMWLTLPVNFSSRMSFSAECSALLQSVTMDNTESPQIVLDKVRKALLEGCDPKVVLSSDNKITSIPRPVGYYEPITSKWVTGKISNFEYLLAINQAAGRRMVDPLYHPVLPWVTDFTAEYIPHQFHNFHREKLRGYSSGGVADSFLKNRAKGISLTQDFAKNPNSSHLRDLTKSKFRLSKGDPQLHTTFRHSDPPHHIPETLSELTFYIYMARCTPIHVLQRIVRNDFVPEHYPQSMERMYDWTPDECIPEFFTDASIFTSIHKERGLTDISLPHFTENIFDFIRYHRSILECDEVSSNLHSWIDLTFGYLLLGEDAIKNLNVPLTHTLSLQEKFGKSPNLDKHSGFVVLFDRPHPKKQSFALKMRVEETKRGEGIFDPKLQALLELNGYEKQLAYIQESTSAAALDSSTQPDPQPKKYLSKGQVDTSLTLLAYARGTKCNLLQQNDHQWDSSETMKFSSRYGSYLEPCYQIPLIKSDDDTSLQTKDAFETQRFVAWDYEFQRQFIESTMQPDERISSFRNLSMSMIGDKCSPKDCIQMLQSQDMFSIGCIIAEVLTGSPILSQSICNENIKSGDYHHIQSLLRACMVDNTPVPLSLRRLVFLLLNFNPAERPTAIDILRSCTASNQEEEYTSHNASNKSEFYEQNINGLIFFNSSQSIRFSQPSSRLRSELLEDYCDQIFPAYFKVAYSFIGRLKVAPDSITRITEAFNNINVLASIPLEGLTLMLPHLLSICVDPLPFRLEDERRKESEQNSDLPMIFNYAKLIDILGERLGMDVSERLLAPCVVKFLGSLQSCSLLESLLQSTLWRVLIFRCGPRCFLRLFLPLLTTYLVCGTLQDISKHGTEFSSSSPLWVSGSTILGGEWLHFSANKNLLSVQQATVGTFTNLSYPDALGPGVWARYVLPALLCLVGVPQLAVTGFRVRRNELLREDGFAESESLNPKVSPTNETTGNSHKRRGSVLFSQKVEFSSLYPEQNMYVVRSIVGIASQIGAVAVGEVILEKVFSEILPLLVSLFFSSAMQPPSSSLEPKKKLLFANSPSKPSIVPSLAGLLEIFSLLQGLLPMLSVELVQHYFFHHNLKQANHLQLPAFDLEHVNLLSILDSFPLPMMNKSDTQLQYDSDDSYDSEVHAEHTQLQISSCIEYRQKCNTHIELCRLIATAATYAGPITTIDIILPAVDRFFVKFVNTYDALDVESDEMSLAFAIGVELFMPLAQLIGPEAFHTAVPSLNPRLELWLASCASGEIGKSPPLPSNIRPEQTSESEEIITPVKEKGFFSWLTSRSSGSTAKEEASFFTPPKFLNPETTPKVEENNLSSSASVNSHNASTSQPSAAPTNSNQRKRRHSRGGLPNIRFSPLPRSGNSTNSSLSRPSSSEILHLLDTPRWNESESRLQSLQVAKVQFQSNRKNFRRPSTTSSSGAIAAILSSSKREHEKEEIDEAKIEEYHRDSSLIVGGSGRWNILKETRLGIVPQHSTQKGPVILANSDQKGSTVSIASKSLKSFGPAAQISMTSPKVTVDTASEAISLFPLKMQNKYSWNFDDHYNPLSNLPPPAVSILVPHISESFLLAGARDGVIKIWSLTANPIRQLSTFSGHSSSVTSAGFLRNGSQTASCDGVIHVWDIETSKSIASLNHSWSEQERFSFLDVVTPRCGISPDMTRHGDNQIVTCSGSTLSHYDFRQNTHSMTSNLKPIAEWKMSMSMQMAVSSLSSNSGDMLPVHLTCSSSNEQYICTGSTTGSLWIFDRRTGKPLHMLQAHDQSIIKV